MFILTTLRPAEPPVMAEWDQSSRRVDPAGIQHKCAAACNSNMQRYIHIVCNPFPVARATLYDRITLGAFLEHHQPNSDWIIYARDSEKITAPSYGLGGTPNGSKLISSAHERSLLVKMQFSADASGG